MAALPYAREISGFLNRCRSGAVRDDVIRVAMGPFRDTVGVTLAGHLDDSARIVAPAELAGETAEAVRDTAVRAFRALDCNGFARVDFLLPAEGAPVVNEINTLPGFRPQSMFPLLWALAGITYRELITRIVDLAMERFREGRKRSAWRPDSR